MGYFADLHIHSRFSRATSKDLNLETLSKYARQKGLKVLGTGDFTHPIWFNELEQLLRPAPEAGLFVLKSSAADESATRFMLSVEISSIYPQGGKSRRVHTLVLLPSMETTKKFNQSLLGRGANLHSDGRPIVGLSAKLVAQLALAADPQAIVIPAHAWTPWFSVFGSMSGFDSLEDCFEEVTPQILAIESGLSSDPGMNWRLSQLDSVAIISCSDAHSAAKLGREATELEGEMSYSAIREALRTGAPARSAGRAIAAVRLVSTIEFFPEEGKYHYDGHREHKVRLSPQERQAHKGLCPLCGRPVTVGVLSRVEKLADREVGFRPEGAPDYRSLVPLAEVIGDALGLGVSSKAVQAPYEKLLENGGNELSLLLNMPLEEIEQASSPLIAEGVRRVRAGQLHIEPGYDGEYGTVHVFSPQEREAFKTKADVQVSLF